MPLLFEVTQSVPSSPNSIPTVEIPTDINQTNPPSTSGELDPKLPQNAADQTFVPNRYYNKQIEQTAQTVRKSKRQRKNVDRLGV